MRFEINDTLSTQAKAALEIIRSRRGNVPPMFKVLAHSPDLALRVEELSTALWNCGLSQATLESLFLVVARHYRCDEQWRRHESRALAAGVTQESINAIGGGLAPKDTPAQHLACSLGKRLLRGQRVGSVLWERAARELGAPAIANVCAFIAVASLVAMTINLQET